MRLNTFVFLISFSICLATVILHWNGFFWLIFFHLWIIHDVTIHFYIYVFHKIISNIHVFDFLKFVFFDLYGSFDSKTDFDLIRNNIEIPEIQEISETSEVLEHANISEIPEVSEDLETSEIVFNRRSLYLLIFAIGFVIIFL